MRTTRLLCAVAVLGLLPASAAALPLDLPLDTPLDRQGAPAGEDVAPATAGELLVGTFLVTAGACTTSATPDGSFFRMVQGGGTAEDGPFVSNTDSPCDDNTATPVTPGSDGGLSTVALQPHPDPAFDPAGSGLATRIIEPARFFGSGFALGTQDPDPQSGDATAVPTVTHDGSGGLHGDLRAAVVAWNNGWYHQGAPKADGSAPGLTTDGATGTYDPATGAFTLDWVSTIEGGAFNGFSGHWHLEGTFEPAAAPQPGPGPTTTDDTTGDTTPTTDTTPADTTSDAAPDGDPALADTGPATSTALAALLLLGWAALRPRRRSA